MQMNIFNRFAFAYGEFVYMHSYANSPSRLSVLIRSVLVRVCVHVCFKFYFDKWHVNIYYSRCSNHRVY